MTRTLKSSILSLRWLIIIFWTVLIVGLAGFALYDDERTIIRDAENMARNYYRLNLFYRAWGARMGGVYVPAAKVTPNPYLNVPHRDVTTDDGQKLTLVNPAYMTRMVFEDILAASPDPIINRLVSIKPLNPQNAPDAWERENLEAFARGERTERSEVTTINGKPYLRLISQFVTDQPCLKCHAHQGYKEGDIRGGITISVPLAQQYLLGKTTKYNTVSRYLLIWFIGMTGFMLMARRQHYFEQHLLESEQKFRTVCDWTQDWEYWVDPSGFMRYVSPSCHMMTGYTPDEYLADKDLVIRIVHPEDRPAFNEHLCITLESGGTDDQLIEFRIVTRSGETRWIQHVCRHVLIDGENLGRRVSNRDITGKKEAEARLEESVRQYHTITGTSPDAFWVVDAGGKLLDVNDQCCVMYGYSRAELLSMSLQDIEVDERPQEIADHIRQIIAKGHECFETRHRCKDGRIIDVVVSTSFIPETQQFLAFNKDITAQKLAELDRQKMERTLQQTQKLESLGVLAGGIAHDFNNILTGIIGNAELALMRLKPESPVLDNLQRIETAAARAADLAKQMLAYSGRGKFVVEQIDLNFLVEEMGHMLDVSISKKAVMRYNLTKPLPTVNVDTTQIRQIIMNLVINASEAIGDRSGVIAISTGCLQCTEAYLQEFWLTDRVPEGLYVSLEVADTGCGMDKETLARIFDPFFTTKFTGRGLGMAAVLGIVRGHKGAIKVYSEPGKGSSFKVLLPAGEKPVELFNGKTASDNWQGTGTVLLVDDEETVRAIGSEMLRELGFEVVTANDGRDAVELYKQRNDISLVILDLTMPHMDGEQCFRELRQLEPRVKVILSSGFSEFEVSQKFAGKGLAGFVQKPYKLSVLREALKNV